MTNLEIYKTLAKKYMKRCVCCDYSDNARDGDKYATSYIVHNRDMIYVCDNHKLDVLQGLFSKNPNMIRQDCVLVNMLNADLIIYTNAMIHYNESFKLTDYEVMVLLRDVIPQCKYCDNIASATRIDPKEKVLVCSHCEYISKCRDVDSAFILGFSFEPIAEIECLIKFKNICDKIKESYEPISFRR